MKDPTEISGSLSATPPPLWEVYIELCEDRLFRRRVGWQHHELVIRHLAHADRYRLAALELREIVRHHLFGSARPVGRRSALADPRQTLRLLRANTLPPADAVARQAPRLGAMHLGNLEPRVGRAAHQWVLCRADTLRRAFFETRQGSRNMALWGMRFVSAPGRDWYQQCLAMMDKGSVRAACRGAFAALDPKLISRAL